MKSLRIFLIVFSGFFLLATTGCEKAPLLPTQTRRAADEKFSQLCKGEYKLNVVTTPLKNTVWIYLPLKKNLFDYKASEKIKKEAPAPKRILKFLDGTFKDRTFQLTFDIKEETSYPQTPGYESYYMEAFQDNQRNILTCVYRAYADLEKIPGDVEYSDDRRQIQHEQFVKAYLKPGEAPDFFVMVIADTTRGIESPTTFYLPDLIRGMTDTSFTEEYGKRLISEELRGSPAIIDDAAGKHLVPEEITWSEFLTKQTLRRIRFKYQQSDFPPKETDVNEILKIVHETVSAYNFKDFDGVNLTDLGNNKTYTFRREQLATFSQ